MRLAFILVLLLAACAPSEPEIICTTHSVEATGGGLTECHEVNPADG